MRATFSLVSKYGLYQVNLTGIDGKPVTPDTLYCSANYVKASAIHTELCSGLINRVTTAILKAGA